MDTVVATFTKLSRWGAYTAENTVAHDNNNNNNNNNNSNNNNKIVTGVGQAGASAHNGNMDTPAHQSPEWHLWRVSAAPRPPPLGLQHTGSWDPLGLVANPTKRRILWVKTVLKVKIWLVMVKNSHTASVVGRLNKDGVHQKGTRLRSTNLLLEQTPPSSFWRFPHREQPSKWPWWNTISQSR